MVSNDSSSGGLDAPLVRGKRVACRLVLVLYLAVWGAMGVVVALTAVLAAVAPRPDGGTKAVVVAVILGLALWPWRLRRDEMRALAAGRWP